jgi:hypothetical protein
MVGDNTIPLPLALPPDDGAARARSPLLPVRHQPDFFVCDIVDAAIKGDTASMEHPVFSLSKKPDMKIRRYENGDKWVEIRPIATSSSTASANSSQR